MTDLTSADVDAAATRITGDVRPVVVTGLEPVRTGSVEAGTEPGVEAQLCFALEFLQHTGTFKARGAKNFIRAHREAGTLPSSGITIASGGNAGLACAWAARAEGIPATVFLPANAPAVKVDRLRGYGADVRLIGSEYAEAAAACEQFVAETGALASHAYDDVFIAAGAGTLVAEILAEVPDLDTIVVSVGGGGLFSGVATAAAARGVRTIAVEPENCRALGAALDVGEPVDVTVDSVAADSLGARRATALAVRAAQLGAEKGLVTSVLVDDESIVAARQQLWDDHRLAVEHAAATALAGVVCGAYSPQPGEKICVVLCGANTDPSDLH